MTTHPKVFSRKNKYYIFSNGNIKDYETIENYNGWIDVVDQDLKKVGEINTELLEYLKKKEKIFTPSFLIEEIEDAVILVDPDGRIFFVNRRYSEVLGVEIRKIIGKYIHKIEPGAQIINVLKHRKPYYNPKTHIKSINKYVALKIKPFYVDGEFCGAYSIFRDVTEINKLTEEVERVKNVAEEYSNQMRAHKAIEDMDIIGYSPNFVRMVDKAITVANTKATILLRGEQGVGKEVIARLIYENSQRRDKPYIVINCAAIPDSLIESELFGYEDGAFTGAKEGGKAGKFELANGGTLFLDEIGDMPFPMQAKLLRVLENNEIEKIGSEGSKSIDVRIIAATNQPLEEMIEKKQFRKDLYYRLNVISIDIPPLRERDHDAIHLANHFLEFYNEKYGKNIGISKEVYKLILKHSWPGNVRELKNFIEHGVILADGHEITVEDIPQTRDYTENIINHGEIIKHSPPDINLEAGSLKMRLANYEKEIITKLLKEYKDMDEVANILSISKRTLYRKIKLHNI